MGRDPKYRGTFGLSPQPVAGVTLYTGRESGELSLEEMLEEYGKSEIRDARKEELLARIRERVTKLGNKKEGKPTSQNPKRYLVDPETGRIDVDEENGEYTYKDALLTSSSIKGKSGQYDDAVALINAAKTLAEGTSKAAPEEKKKEFFVDDEGIIHHDPENGELTLSEARAVSQSKRPQASPPSNTFIDSTGKVHHIEPGQPIVIEKVGQPGVNYFVTPTGELQEIKPGQPIVVKVETKSESLFPVQTTGPDGQRVVMDIDKAITWKKFEGEERRAEEELKNKQEMMGEVKNLMSRISAAAQRYTSRHE